jgi:hypothetical protein
LLNIIAQHMSFVFATIWHFNGSERYNFFISWNVAYRLLLPTNQWRFLLLILINYLRMYQRGSTNEPVGEIQKHSSN